MDSLIVGLAIEAQARQLDDEAAALRDAGAREDVGSPAMQAWVREEVARQLHAIAARLWGPDRQQDAARSRGA